MVGDFEIPQAVIASGIAVLSGAASAVAATFYWGGGTKAELEAIKRAQAEMQESIRQILGFLIAGHIPK